MNRATHPRQQKSHIDKNPFKVKITPNRKEEWREKIVSKLVAMEFDIPSPRNEKASEQMIQLTNETIDEFNSGRFAPYYKCRIEYDLFQITKRHE